MVPAYVSEAVSLDVYLPHSDVLRCPNEASRRLKTFTLGK